MCSCYTSYVGSRQIETGGEHPPVSVLQRIRHRRLHTNRRTATANAISRHRQSTKRPINSRISIVPSDLPYSVPKYSCSSSHLNFAGQGGRLWARQVALKTSGISLYPLASAFTHVV